MLTMQVKILCVKFIAWRLQFETYFITNYIFSFSNHQIQLLLQTT